MKVSIVLPAYNEAERIERAVGEVKRAAEATGYDYEIIIAEDGSTDGTDAIAARIASEDGKVRHLHSDERLGRGRALMRAFEAAEGDVVVYMDVDLATDLKHLKELIDAVAVEGYDIATGSRLMRGSDASRPLKRDLASRAYNLLVRLLLGSKLRDHQCGFKAFRREVVLEIGKEAKDGHWFWDTEVLVLAQRKGLRVKEIPVRWRHGGATKVDFRRDVVYMFSQILRMWSSENRRGLKLFSALLALMIVLTLVYLAGTARFVQYLSMLNFNFLAAAFALYSASYIFRGARFSYILGRVGASQPVTVSAAAVSISQTVNVVTPVRIGDLARAFVFAKRGVEYEKSLGGVAAERIFDVASIAVIAAVAAAYLGISAGEIYYAAAFAALAAAAVAALSRMENFVGRISRVAVTTFNLRDGVVLFALSSLIWLTDIATCYLILGSFSANFALAALAVAVGNIVKAVPITPGGIGTYEAAVAAVLSRGYEFGLAITVAIVDHAVKNVATVLLGAAAMLWLNVRLKDLE
ncbi:MAG: lysylphosphatidylglycerol synthase domain-containing protein [Archaeoglobaceae archaeon]